MRLETILISDINFGSRTREEYGDIATLAESIRDDELITPIAVYDTEVEGQPSELRFRLLAGGRRIKACESLGMTEIPARIFDVPMGEIDMLVVELSENLFRKDLSWQEDVAIKQKIHDHQIEKFGQTKPGGYHRGIGEGEDIGWSVNKTARLLGESPGGISQDLQLAGLVEELPALGGVRHKSDALKMIKSAGTIAVRKAKAKEVQKEIETQQDKIKKDLVDRFVVGDFFEGIKDIPDNSVDFIEIDPPYAIDLPSQRRSEGAGMTTVNYNEIPAEEYETFIDATLKESYRVLSPEGWLILWFGPEPWFENMYKLLKNNHLQTRRIPGIWTKNRGQTMQPHIYLANTYEMFYYAHKGQGRIVKQGRSNEFEFPGVPHREEGHPTPRPIELIQELIETFCEPGGRGIVSFLGSGNTLLAMANKGMRGIGWELTPEYKDPYVIKVHEGQIGSYKSYD